jgi:DNA modification methylase
MNIQKISIGKLKPAAYNPRKDLQPGDPEYQKIRRSIETYGYIDPIIANKDLTVIGGHQRLKVLKDLGFEEVECVLVDLDKEHEKSLNIALNKISGEWDMGSLKDLIAELDTGEFDLELTGFDMDEIEKLMAGYNGEEADEDDFDIGKALEEVIDPVTKHGDIWLLGKHRLLCGDSTSEEDVNVLMAEAKADMVFTDPPWNVNYGAMDEGNAQGYKPRTILNDFMGTEDFKDFMDRAFRNMSLASKDGCMTYVVMSAQEWGNMMLTLGMNDYHWSSTLIWNKDRLVLSRKDYHTKYEPIWYGWKEGKARLHPLDDRKQSDVWAFERPSKSEEHPTMKPVALVDRAIRNSSKRGDLVLDLFGGSGTTLIAAEGANRTCNMMELDPKYCDVIVKRYIESAGEPGVFLCRNGEKMPYHKSVTT